MRGHSERNKHEQEKVNQSIEASIAAREEPVRRPRSDAGIPREKYFTRARVEAFGRAIEEENEESFNALNALLSQPAA